MQESYSNFTLVVKKKQKPFPCCFSFKKLIQITKIDREADQALQWISCHYENIRD